VHRYLTLTNGKIASAELLLRRSLGNGAKPCAQVYAASAAENIGKRSVDTAKKNLGVKSQKRPEGWYWLLEGDGK